MSDPRAKDTGDAMVRYVHSELTAALALLAGTGMGAAVAVGVHDSSVLRAGSVGRAAIFAVVFLTLVTLVRGTRLKWVGEVANFEAALPLPSAAPAQRPFGLGRLLLFLLPNLVVGVLGFTWVLLVPLAMALDWLAKAAVGARWERGNGRLLWLGQNREEPMRLSYSPISPPPPTRTATDAPPA
ncbi:hypothetical protein [Streptomyces xylophagus]|uniref:hypothetical protein n=1 Tax=Streptomyces xylophagus TaxID=285514 RepID=UPI0005BBFA60|nr:hypothetical protein [Streptomyces xylophagus]